MPKGNPGGYKKMKTAGKAKRATRSAGGGGGSKRKTLRRARAAGALKGKKAQTRARKFSQR